MADEDDRDERGGERSGRYPSASLGDALEAADKLYKAERQSPMTNDTAAVKMGYKSLSGPARQMIAALRQYGLIERVSSGQFRLSKLAIEAIHGNPTQKANALKVAALTAPLFQDLQRTHLDASEDNIRSYLITTKSFIDIGAAKAAKAFRETMELAKISASGYDTSVDRSDAENNQSGGWNPPLEQMLNTAVPPPTPSPATPAGATLPPLSWVLSVPRGVRAELRISGSDVRREDLERLKKQIDFLVDSFSDDAE